MRVAVVVVLLATISVAHGAQILGLFPFPGKSHMIMISAFMKELARRGHQVTMMSYFPEKEPFANLTDISLGTMEYKSHKVPVNLYDLGEQSIFETANMMWDMGLSMTDVALSSPPAVELLHSTDRHFDVVVMDAFFNEAFLGYALKFDAPIVQICAFGGTAWMGDWVGNPSMYSYVPDAFLPFGDRMTFWQRLENAIVGMYVRLGRAYYYMPRQDALLKKHFGGVLDETPSLEDLERSTSLVLLNNHFSLSQPKPFMPNMVQVGGLHVKEPRKLPQDLQQYLDSATDGVIYFSMGSNFNSSMMSEAARTIFLNVFSTLKQKVLWKWEKDTLPGLPPNVKVGKWLPQSDILAHPNVRVFISHGGMLSTQEASNRGVPVIGIPIFADQRLNILQIVASGFGVQLEYKTLSEESLSAAIDKVLQPKYRENAQRLSRIYRDQPLTPMETAVFWTEYVIRHGGAPHMRSAALDLTWYQYFLLDVIAFLAAVVSVPIYLVYFLLKRIHLRKTVGEGNPEKKKKQ